MLPVALPDQYNASGDSFPIWPPPFHIQNPFLIVAVQRFLMIEDIDHYNQDPRENPLNVNISALPYPQIVSAANSKFEEPFTEGSAYRGVFGMDLYDYWEETKNYKPDPNKIPGGDQWPTIPPQQPPA